MHFSTITSKVLVGGGIMPNKIKPMLTSESDEWETPHEFFTILDQKYGFTLDPCATPENAKCIKYYTTKEDGLKQDWFGETVFCNPPYGRQIKKWVKKAFEESLKGTIVVMLVPARTDTSYWHDYIFGKAEIEFIRGRVKFVKSGELKNSAPFPSAVVIFKKTSTKSKEENEI